MNLVDILLEVTFPDEFSLAEFEALSSVKDRKAYCEKDLKFLGEGSSRIVYDIDNYTVIKMAKNKKGIEQNRVEANPSFQNYDIMAKIFQHDKQHTYLIMERADKATTEEFQDFTGLDIADFKKYLGNLKKQGRGQKYDSDFVEKYEDKNTDNNFLEETKSCMKKFNMSSGDLSKITSWGRVKRGGKYAMVLIDYGLTSEIYQKYYKK